MCLVYGVMSVLSAGLVAGPGFPTFRLRRDVSISWGAKRRLSWCSSVVGDKVRGDASGVSSGFGPTLTLLGAVSLCER